MKAETYSQIKTLVPISVDGIDFPKNTLGAVVETYSSPEGYAVDLAIPDSQLVGGFQYHNVILTPEQFAVMENTHQDEVQALSNIIDILEVYCQDILVKNKIPGFYNSPKFLKFSNAQWKSFLNKFLILYYVLFSFFSAFVVLFRFFNIYFAKNLAIICFILILIVILVYIVLLIYFSWQNSKTKQENIRKFFTKFKEEYDLVNSSSRDSKGSKAELYSFYISQHQTNNNLIKRKKQYIEELRKNSREEMQEIEFYFKDKQKEAKKKLGYFQKATPLIGFCFVLFSWLFLGQDFFKNLPNLSPFIKLYGVPAFLGITLFPLISLLLEIDTLLFKIYEECISILERALK